MPEDCLLRQAQRLGATPALPLTSGALVIYLHEDSVSSLIHRGEVSILLASDGSKYLWERVLTLKNVTNMFLFYENETVIHSLSRKTTSVSKHSFKSWWQWTRGLESVLQSEVSQKGKSKYHILMYMWKLETWYRGTYLQGRNRDTDVEKWTCGHAGTVRWTGRLGLIYIYYHM